MITIEQLKDVKERTEALYRYLDIEGKKIQVEEEQLRTQAPGFWDDQKAAEAQMKKVKGLQQWIAGYNEIKTLSEELQLAFDFYKDELVTEEEVDEAYAKASTAIDELELKNMLREEADQMDCVLKINSGAGGTESQDWASMLMRMYLRYAETNGYKAVISNLQEGDEAGIKTCTIEISGDYAYGYLKGENGVHRLVRVMQALDQAGVSADEIKYFILHQANIRIIEAVAKKMGQPIEKFPTNLQECGNISAGSVPILLDFINKEGKLNKGDKIVLAGFGAGLTWGAAVLVW